MLRGHLGIRSILHSAIAPGGRLRCQAWPPIGSATASPPRVSL